ncbi:hypothetical protein MCEMRE26_00152 [Candidatus Nanopelagicaceae bacterium]
MKRIVLLILIVLTFPFVSSSAATELDGILDTTLGTEGYIGWNENVEANLVQVIKLSDGNLLHFGSISDGDSSTFCSRNKSSAVAVKTDTAGSVDLNFNFYSGSRGSVSMNFSDQDFFVSAAENAEGKIFLLGVSQEIIQTNRSDGVSCTSNPKRVYVVKLDESGTVDLAFGVDGFRDLEMGVQAGYPGNLSILDNGAILVSFYEGEGFDLLSLDVATGETNTAFGNEGLVKLSKSNMRVFKAIQTDSTIILFGDKFNPDDDGANRWAISSIDLQGNELENFKGSNNYEYSTGRKEGIFVQPKYLSPYVYIVAGVLNGSTYEIQAIRVNKNGARDQSYGGYLRDQLLAIGVDPCGYCSGDFAVDQYGRVLVSIGTDTFVGGQRQSVVVRLDQDGLIDTTFGTGGKIWVNYDYQAGVVGIDLNKFLLYGTQYSSSYCVPGECGLYKLFISQFGQLAKNENPSIENLVSKVGEVSFAVGNIDTESTYSIITNAGQVSIDTQTARGKVTGLGDASRIVNVEVRSSKSGFGVGKVRFRAQTLDSEAIRIEIQKVVEKQREIEKTAARNEIMDRLKVSKKIDLETFAKASIVGVTSKNIEAIEREILELPIGSRSDLTAVLKIVRKYEVVDKVASGNRIYSSMLQEVGLIPQESAHKATLTAAVRKLPASDRSSYLAIKQAIDAQMAKIEIRKKRLSEAVARSSARRKD